MLLAVVGWTAAIVACQQKDAQMPSSPKASETFPEPKSSPERTAYLKLAAKQKEFDEKRTQMIIDHQKEVEVFCATNPVTKGFRGPSLGASEAPAATEENRKADRELTELRRGHRKAILDHNLAAIKFTADEYIPAVVDYGAYCHKTFLADPSPANGGALVQVTELLYDNGNVDEVYLYCSDMVKNGFDSMQLNDLAAASAYCTDRIAEAAEYYQKARERKQYLRSALVTTKDHLQVAKEAWEKEEKIRAAEAAADDLPRVKLETEAGDIVVELFENEAPETVANYISLVESGYYDNTDFFAWVRTAEFFLGSKNGGPNSDPGYHIYCEAEKPDRRFPFRGALSMFVQAKDQGGSVYTITTRPAPNKDGSFTTFGRVIEGFDVLPKIAKYNNRDPMPGLETTKVRKATVLRKRDHEYQPSKVQ
jgi:cyclophilin family peptidyl-prolyl cis-trans isomerase